MRKRKEDKPKFNEDLFIKAITTYRNSDKSMVNITKEMFLDYHDFSNYIKRNPGSKEIWEETRRRRNIENKEEFNQKALKGLRWRLSQQRVYEIKEVYEPINGPEGVPEYEYERDENGATIKDKKGLPVKKTFTDDRGVEMPVEKVRLKFREVKERVIPPDSKLIEFQLKSGLPEVYGENESDSDDKERVFKMQGAPEVKVDKTLLGAENEHLIN